MEYIRNTDTIIFSTKFYKPLDYDLLNGFRALRILNAGFLYDSDSNILLDNQFSNRIFNLLNAFA
jgi:hypothetical protein